MNPIARRPGAGPAIRALRPASLAVGLTVMCSTALTGCTVSVSSSSSPSALAESVCTAVAEQVRPTADPLRVGNQDEYGELPNLIGGQSLYFTSWGSRLAAAAGRLPSVVDRDATLNWLEYQLATIDSEDANLESSKADTARRALLGIVALGGNPAATSDLYANLRTGWGYSANPGDDPSEGATLMVAQGLDVLGERLPDGVVAHIEGEAAAFQPSDDLEAITNRELPSLQALAITLSSEELREIIPNLEDLLAQWSQAAADSGVSALQLANLHALSEIASAAGLTPPELDASEWSSLRTPGGLWALAPNGAGDPQTTFLALDLGITSAESVITGLDGGASRAGWYATVGEPSLSALYKASAIKYLCGNRLAARGPQLDGWTSRVLSNEDADALSIYQVCTLHKIFGEPLSDADSTDLATRARTFATSSHEPLTLAQAAVAMRACGSDEKPATNVASLSSVSTLTSLSANGLHVLDDMAGTEGFDYRAFLETTRVGNLQGATTDARTADLYSTGFALDYLEAPLEDRQEALERFAVDDTWSELPPGPGSPSPSATLSSLLMATIIATGGSADISPLMIW